MTVVQTLGPSSYCGFMETVGDGIDAYTHKALVRFHEAPKAVDAYVKVYCVDQAPRGLVNELIGYSFDKDGGSSWVNDQHLLDDYGVRFVRFTLTNDPQG